MQPVIDLAAIDLGPAGARPAIATGIVNRTDPFHRVGAPKMVVMREQHLTKRGSPILDRFKEIANL